MFTYLYLWEDILSTVYEAWWNPGDLLKQEEKTLHIGLQEPKKLGFIYGIEILEIILHFCI